MMRTLKNVLLVVLCLACNTASAAAQEGPPATKPTDNPELRELFQADQAARTGEIAHDLMAQDHRRRVRVREIMAAGEMRTAADHFHAAMVFQHGTDPDDYKLAHELAKKAAELDPSLRTARWLSAAAMDRYLLAVGKPQIYGTQYMVIHGVWALRPIDETAVTDEQRLALGVPTLEQARERARKGTAERQVDPEDSRELDALFVEFITERMGLMTNQRDVTPRMREIAVEALKLVEGGAAKTARDIMSAVEMLEPLAGEPEDYQRIVEMLEAARQGKPDDREIGFTYARMVDKLRMAEGRGQWYGTAAVPPERSESGRWELPRIDPQSPVTEEERTRLGIPPREVWEAQVARLNAELDRAATRPAD